MLPTKQIELGQFAGYGNSDNYGIFFMDYMHGGNNVRDTFAAPYGKTYIENRTGLSIGLPAAYTRQFSYTWLFGGD